MPLWEHQWLQNDISPAEVKISKRFSEFDELEISISFILLVDDRALEWPQKRTHS